MATMTISAAINRVEVNLETDEALAQGVIEVNRRLTEDGGVWFAAPPKEGGATVLWFPAQSTTITVDFDGPVPSSLQNGLLLTTD